MDSLRINGSVTLGGGAVGISGDTELTRAIDLRFLAALSSAGTGAELANDALFYSNRTLTASGDESFDLTSFTSVLRETGATMSKVRIYVVYHSSASVATGGIRVGGAGTPFAGFDETAAVTKLLKPGEGFAFLSPTTAGMSVSAGQSVRIRNVDASNTATYTIGLFGE